MTGFEHALPEIRRGIGWRRMTWKPGKHIGIYQPPAGDMMSFIAIIMPDGSFAPWTPTRCDLLERDWERADGS